MKKVVPSLLQSMSLLLLMGCYSYQPVTQPVVGMEVRARLKTEAAVRRSQGMDDAIMRVDGRILEVTPDALALDILVVRSNSAFQSIEMRDTLKLANTEIDALLGRKFAPARTGIFVIGSLAAVYGILRGIDQVVGGTDDPGDGGNPTFTIPLAAWLNAKVFPAITRSRRPD